MSSVKSATHSDAPWDYSGLHAALEYVSNHQAEVHRYDSIISPPFATAQDRPNVADYLSSGEAGLPCKHFVQRARAFGLEER